MLAALVLVAVSCSSSPGDRQSASLKSSPSVAGTALRYSLDPWGVTPSNNPYNPDYNGDPFSEVEIPLAYAEPTRSGKYIPELAKSLAVAGSRITFHLRPTARWQDGQPFTSQDVITSFLLAGADGNAAWGFVASIAAPNPHTVMVDVKPGVAAALVLYDLTEISIVPNQQYGPLLAKGLENDLLKYWNIYRPLDPTTATVAAASASPESKTMSAVAAALVKFNPPKMVGDGPFRLVKATTSEILLKKWSGFWDARQIEEPYIEVFAMTDTVSVPAFLSGRLDFTEGATYDDATYNKLNATKGLKLFGIPYNQELGILFNYRHYPFNLAAVRQAVAYLIPRKKLTELDVGGTVSQRPPVPVPVGISISLANQWLSKGQRASLNSYSYSPSKAAKLLRSVGFVKKDGAWYTPKGTKFTAEISVDDALALFESDGNAISNDLSKFGIHTTTDALSSTSFGSLVSYGSSSNGSFDMAYWFIEDSWQTDDPLVDLESTFTSDNYPSTWDGRGKCPCSSPTIGMPPIERVPGLGDVDVAQAITREATTIGSHSKWRTLTWDWARLFNQQLPALPLENNVEDVAQSTARYDDWPPSKASKWLYPATGTGATRIMVSNQYGFIKLRHP